MTPAARRSNWTCEGIFAGTEILSSGAETVHSWYERSRILSPCVAGNIAARNERIFVHPCR